jgi:stage III sporulation protein AC
MDVSVIFKIASIGIITIVVSQILQHSGKGELATLANLAGLVMVLAIVLNMIGELFDTIRTMFSLY